MLDLLKVDNPQICKISQISRGKFSATFHKDIESFLALFRFKNSDILYHKCAKETKKGELTLTDKIDRVVVNRWLSFPILLLVIIFTYQASIVLGYKITDYTWPLFGTIKNFVADASPAIDIARVPIITDFANWLVNSAIALLNYLPIFFILFALIAIMEDVGYMPRMAFILDRVFRKFELHGQSTLPLVLGGAFVGGCAVPGVMSTKGIADDRARMATIMSVPLMNCLAKVPFYTLLLGAFFVNDTSLMLFYISTVTLLAALIIAKGLTSTILKTRETAPFVMELPPYHMPTFKGVILRAVERIWIYIKKVCTIVIGVAIVLFVLLQFPSFDSRKQKYYSNEESKILTAFDKAVSKTSYYALVDSREEVADLLNFYDGYRSKKMAGSKSADENYKKKNPEFYKFLRVEKDDKDAKKINTAPRKLSSGRNTILRNQKNDKIENSLLGMAGKVLEPITQFAGFDWKINVVFLSSFAARESAVATLGSIYEAGKVDLNQTAEISDINVASNLDMRNTRPEETMSKNSGYTPLHATSIIIFMLLTPPCIATMIVVKMQTNSWAWMLFAIFFPFTIGLAISSLVFTLGSIFELSGVMAMSYYYFALLAIVLILAFIPSKVDKSG